MYSEKQLIKLLERDLGSECAVIKFYIENLEKLNYKENKKALDELIMGSARHAEMIVKCLLDIKSKKNGKLSEIVAADAFREETGVREIYAYQLNRTDNPKVRKLLKELIKQEKEHERLVRSLK